MRRSIQGMLEELEYNLWEHILSRLVDYGHAFSPEIEMAALQGDEALLLHGEAVNIDMALTTQVFSCFSNLQMLFAVTLTKQHNLFLHWCYWTSSFCSLGLGHGWSHISHDILLYMLQAISRL